jgi:hypothetical protein
MGAETTPSGRTILIVPMLSVTRKLPSGRNARDQGLVSRAVIVSTLISADGFDGGGASVWPGNAGFGFLGVSPAKRLGGLAAAGACGLAEGNIIAANAASVSNGFFMAGV